MEKRLFLLDGMGLVYRAHFAFVNRPIFTAKGVNTSALYGFTQTLLEIIKNQKPTHLAVAFDTGTPTQRHRDFPEYKAQRQVMPEDITAALPQVRRMLEAFNIPVLTCDGFEADDIIGTLVRKADKEGFTSYMVTSDKDFAQLVTEKTFFYKPSRMGDAVEVFGLPEIRTKWGVQEPKQVIDIIALWGDTSDNIPGVPGVGEKTAIKLISKYGSVENLLSHSGELSGAVKQSLETNRDQALLSKKLATIICDAPCEIELESLKVQPANEKQLKDLLLEFEFNSIARRLFGDDFRKDSGAGSAGQESQQREGSAASVRSAKAGVSATRAVKVSARSAKSTPLPPRLESVEDLVLEGESVGLVPEEPVSPPADKLKTIATVPHQYEILTTSEQRARLCKELQSQQRFCVDVEAASLDPKEALLLGLAFSFQAHTGCYVPMPADARDAKAVLEEFRSVLESDRIEKIGHNLKYDLSVLKWHGVTVRGKLFDTMIAHSLIEPELRHDLEHLSEVYLGYTPVPFAQLIGEKKSEQIGIEQIPLPALAEYAAEDADVTWQLHSALEPLLKEKGQERVFHEIESPLIPVLVDMEVEGIRIDAGTLAEFATQLGKEIADQEKTICRMAGTEFNLNSPRQLGQVLFDVLKICANVKKTRTGQYATDERTLTSLAGEHEIVRRLLEYRTATKIKSTYVDALPVAIWPKTARVHTTFNQTMTATGRLNSQNPNLQNIPIRRERGQEVRKAFVPRNADYALISADYSQIELRIIASLSGELGLVEALKSGLDVHTATAARIYGVPLDIVTAEMRRKAKMVNYGIAYGISAFGLAQRLGIPRSEGAVIIEQYFKQFPRIRKYMNDTIAFARRNGYVETVTGRRRYIRDIRSAHSALRGAAERNAINAPIQGTAADMIKLAMINIQRELTQRNARTRMLLQVHDELVFDLFREEKESLLVMIEDKMKTAIPLEVPIVVEIGIGENWLEAH